MTRAEPFSPAQAERFRTFAARRLGLRFDEGKLAFLSEILLRRCEKAGLDPESYLAHLDSGDPKGREARLVVEELTVTETFFFRSFDQFRALGEVALPARIRERAGNRRLRILSAGCASGEEAYSLAILLRDLPTVIGWDLGIRAIDVNTTMLAKAAQARYSRWSLRETPPDVQARCFRPEGPDFVLDASFRSMVTFEERNLADEDPSFWRPEAFDIVFFRNVVMYFTPEIAERVIARMSRSLVPGGFLFLGYAETLRGLSQDFHLCHTHGTFYYQRRGRDERRSGSQIGDGHVAEVSPADPRLADVVGSDDSWVETIRRASDHIHALTTRPAGESATLLPAGIQPTPAAAAVFEIGVAVDLIRREQFVEARAMLAALPGDYQRDADVMLLRAVLLTHGGDLVAAEELCAEVLKVNEMSAGAHYLTALCREGAGDRRGATDHDQVAAYIDPGFAMPRLHLGLLARRGGDQAAARRELGEALSLLQREDTSRLLLFAGGFSREALVGICRAELLSCGGPE